MKALVTKRAFDLTLILLSAPIWLAALTTIAVLVRFKLGSPVFFRQRRPGLNEHIFELVKFRSMLDRRNSFGDLLPDAMRLTAFGRLLRASSLDELPELWNVLKGEMSLVGPRPLLVEYLPLYTVEQRQRHDVPPGLTGWAQVNGRNALTWEQKFEFDRWYVKNRSLWLDAKIILITCGKVLNHRGISAEGEATMPRFQGSLVKNPLP